MIAQISLPDLFSEFELIPQAIINEPPDVMARRLKFELQHGEDDLDEYVGFGVDIDQRLKFALMRYMGYPEDTITIYLPNNVRDVNVISETIQYIITMLDIPEPSIQWQRSDNPEL